ncbi:hypothetical protein DDB_G0292236 [Dictyostelium discoideum AX4]|uniref:Transmembrane protein n=1 Tax=Dictyostelium discoideum TaxID=44689 RepID=Q54DI2_DICDI|nr:hypothetical protein DDB_G0292236 [Dictyostelium discoideum AX4]EAL61328.1 hypothetical protein DDB_G0292236 [Dictyostelium discoideum AX4]|eukprot:XP_629745.1 hypothetical protein DDB_G0292236 [Dictyostelium discoideum AX4]
MPQKFYLLILTVFSILLTKINCELQLPYFYSFESTGNFQVINVETNEAVLNSTLSIDLQVLLVYGSTISTVSNKPIFNLFVSEINSRVFYTIDYDSDSNQFSNKSVQLTLPTTLGFEYDPSTFFYNPVTNSFILPCHIDGLTQNVLSFIEWDFKNSKINTYKNVESFKYMTLPISAYNPYTDELFTFLTGPNNAPYVQINMNNSFSVDNVKVIKFPSKSATLPNIGNIFINTQGGLVGTGYIEGTSELFVCEIDFKTLSCSIEYTTLISSFDNNFSVIYPSSDLSYLIILVGNGFNCDTIEINYLNLFTYKVDYTFKINNFFKNPQDSPVLFF